MAARLSLGEIRRRHLEGDAPAPPRLLNELELDPRPGARRLLEALRRRRQGRRDEQIRLATLLNFERVLWKAGVRHIAGVDEVGVGPLAGPVVAAAVILPADVEIAGIDDSKRLDEPSRDRLDAAIRACAVAVAVAEVPVEEVDRLNVYRAGLEAMRRAVLGLGVTPGHVLVDARVIPGLGDLPQNAFEKGDGLNFSIACASIVAKVWRDRRMNEMAHLHPGYGFERHKGYGTPAHLAAIRRLGGCPIHRRSFPVLAELEGEATPRFYEIRLAIAQARTLADLAALGKRLRADTGLLDTEARKLQALMLRRRRRLGSASPGR